MRASLFKIVVFTFCFFIFNYSHCNRSGANHLLPDNFIGNVVIIYDVSDGVAKKYDHGRRIYEIPSSGVLLTKFSPYTGWHAFDEYYYDNHERTPLTYIWANRTLSNDSVYVWASSFGRSAMTESNRSEISFTIYSVGPPSAKDSLDKERQKIYAPNLLKEYESK